MVRKLPEFEKNGVRYTIDFRLEEIKEAAKYGMTEQDLIDLVLSTYRDWQADC